ncbi:MAG: dihydroneopterin aldolase [Sandaracinaceae bacterium]
MSARATDVIAITGLRVDCVVGIHPHERHRMQPLEIDLEMAVDTRAAGDAERLALTVDYAATTRQVAFLLRSCKFFMLEAAARAITRWILAPPASGEARACVQEVALTLRKPYALAGHGVPSLRVVRHADEITLKHEENAWGTVDILDETRHVGIYRLNIAPAKGIPLHVHRQMQEAEHVLTEGLLCQGKPVTAGTEFRWPKEAPHRYDNPTDRVQSILCVDSPPFIPDDEIPVHGEPADVPPEPPFLPAPVQR